MDTRRAIVAFILAAGVLMTALTLAGDQTTQPVRGKLRVGVYDNRAVAIAYARSDAFRDSLADWKKQFDQAQQAGDEKQVQRVKQAMDRMQWLSHRQGFGRASVDDAIAQVKDKLPEVARHADVRAIVCNPDFIESAGVETVDLTDEIVALFQPDERVLQMIKQVKVAQPIEVGFDFND